MAFEQVRKDLPEKMVLPHKDGLDAGQIKFIYRREYWDSTCDQLPFPTDVIHYYTSIDSGKGHAANYLKDSNGNWREYLRKRLYGSRNERDKFNRLLNLLFILTTSYRRT